MGSQGFAGGSAFRSGCSHSPGLMQPGHSSLPGAGEGEEGPAHSLLQHPVSALRNPAGCCEGGGRQASSGAVLAWASPCLGSRGEPEDTRASLGAASTGISPCQGVLQHSWGLRLLGSFPARGYRSIPGGCTSWEPVDTRAALGAKLCQRLNPGTGFFFGEGRRNGECCGTVLRASMIVPKADKRHAWISRAAAGLASVSNVLCLAAMLCRSIFSVGGGNPLPGPRRVGGFLQGSRKRLRVFLGRVVQPRGRGKAVELAGRVTAHGKLQCFFQGGSFGRLQRGRERGWHREGMAGVGRSWLEGAQSCLGKEETQWKRVIPGQHGSRRQGQGQASTGMSDKRKQLPSPGLLVVISAPDMQTLRGPPPLPPSPQLGEGWPGCLMKCRAAWESRGEKKALFEVLCLWFPLALSPSGVIYWRWSLGRGGGKGLELQANSHRLFPEHSREAKEKGEEREVNCLDRG